jgi:hypothetical protein
VAADRPPADRPDRGAARPGCCQPGAGGHRAACLDQRLLHVLRLLVRPVRQRPGGVGGLGRGAAPSSPITITGTDLGPVPGGSSVLPEAVNERLAAKSPRYYAEHYTGTSLATAADLNLSGGAGRAARSVGEVLQVTIRGEHTGISTGSALVYLPPEYFQQAYAHARFPVVLAMTGYPNETWSIVRFLALPATAARLTAEGKIRPAVYVMMNASVALPRDTECTNIPAGLQVESFFAQDVPLAMEQTFRVQADGSGWAALGYSTGGYCRRSRCWRPRPARRGSIRAPGPSCG